MNPQFDHKFLEQYLAEKMSPVEKMAFEARLAGDNVLRAELEAMKRMRSDSKSDKANKHISSSNELTPSPAKSTYYWAYLLIAFLSFAALLFIVFYWL